jgi:hypothetical protein
MDVLCGTLKSNIAVWWPDFVKKDELGPNRLIEME